MIKRIFYILILAFAFNSCYSPFMFNTRTIFKPKGYSAKYTGVDEGLDSLIKIKGYYLSDTITGYNISSLSNDTLGIYLRQEVTLFYNDGTVCHFFVTPIDFTENEITKNSHNSLEFMSIITNGWGIYKIVGDSIIKSEYLFYIGGRPLLYNESQYLIVSDTVLKSISKEDVEKDKAYLHFHPYPDRFGSELNPYLKKRWYWNKEAYKKMKEEKKKTDFKKKNR